MKQNKYIILMKDNRLEFRCGFVFRHADLLDRWDEDRDVIGGGYFRFDTDMKSAVLYGTSDDFGCPRDMHKNLRACASQVKERLGDEYYYHFTDEEEMSDDWQIIFQDKTGRNWKI